MDKACPRKRGHGTRQGGQCQPYHGWGRGANENTNGLLSQFFGKGMNFGTILPSDADLALALLNNRPRKCMNYRTPTEVFWSKPICCVSD
jgi:IS30 family transposase